MHTHKQRKQSITIWHNGNNFLLAMKANNAAVCVKWLKLVLGAFVKLQHADLRQYVVGTGCTTNLPHSL